MGPEGQTQVGVGLKCISNKRPSVSPEDDLETFVSLRLAGWPEWA